MGVTRPLPPRLPPSCSIMSSGPNSLSRLRAVSLRWSVVLLGACLVGPGCATRTEEAAQTAAPKRSADYEYSKAIGSNIRKRVRPGEEAKNSISPVSEVNKTDFDEMQRNSVRQYGAGGGEGGG